MSGCPNDEIMAAFADGTLDPGERAAIHGHIDGCVSCQWLLRELASEPSGLDQTQRTPQNDEEEGEPPVDAAAPTRPGTRAATRRDPIAYAPGALVGDGRYRLDKLLGAGGMGTVWSAVHLGTDRPVALKILRQERLATQAARLRFLREARLLGRIEHANLVPVRDVFDDEAGTPILAMDLLRGESLTARLQREGALPLHAVARWFPSAMAAVQKAHAAGIVHRDLKPDNLFLVLEPGQEPQLRVLDFGIAKLLEPTPPERDGEQPPRDHTLTEKGEVMGTPPYMAPEQLRGEELDQRVDVWAFGVVLYQCLSGQRPFVGTRLGQYFDKITTGKRAPLAEVAPELPADVLELVESMLTVERDGRPPDLRLAIRVLQSHAEEQSAPPTPTAAPRPRGRTQLPLAILLIALGVVGTLGVSAMRKHAEPERTTKRNPNPDRRPGPSPTPSPSPSPNPNPNPNSTPTSSQTPPFDRNATTCAPYWGPVIAARVCGAPQFAMREAAYRAQQQLGDDTSSLATDDALRGELASCDSDACLLGALQNATPRIAVVDCAHAVSTDAKTICRSTPLATLAGTLAATYQRVRDDYRDGAARLQRLPGGRFGVADGANAPRPVPSPAQLAPDQTAWLIVRHRCNDDEACLERAFADRILQLQRVHRAFAATP